jgi:hypothetical protein
LEYFLISFSFSSPDWRDVAEAVVISLGPRFVVKAKTLFDQVLGREVGVALKLLLLLLVRIRQTGSGHLK